MSRYEEINPRWYWFFFLLIAFALIYFPLQLGDRELYWDEGTYAAMATEMNFQSPLTVAHGELIPNSFPLFPYLAAILHRFFGLPMEYALRLISVLSLFGLSLLCWEVGRRALDFQAALVASLVMFSSGIIIEKGIDGYPHMLALFFLFSGWLTWFTFGVARGSWNKAWIYSIFFCGLALYTIGWSALFYFFLPLLFMRRPMTVWPKLRKPGFVIAMLVLAAFILMWGIPRWSVGEDLPRPLQIDPRFTWVQLKDYLLHLAVYPFEITLRFLPWSIFAWAPLCVAFFPLDKNPIFSRFLRTIFISLAIIMWVSPWTESRDLIFLAPPLAVLTGINYWLVARRYGHLIHQMLHFFSYAAIAAGILIIAFYLIPHRWISEFYTFSRDISFNTNIWYFVMGLSQGGLCIVIGLYLRFCVYRNNRGRCWEHIILITIAFALMFWAIVAPYRAQERDKREYAREVRNAIKKSNHFSGNLMIYQGPRLDGMFGEGYYIGCRIRQIHDLDELPGDLPRAYLITDEVPVSANRNWTKLTDNNYRGRKIQVWMGDKIQKPQGHK